MNKYLKYPRTFHLPWSEGATDDDKRLKNIDHFLGKEVIVTEKLDGENCTMYHDHLHARSIDSKDHPSRHWVKMLHASISHDIPVNWRLCGENMYAKHSIYYRKLTSYFYLFSIWNEQNSCLSWTETLDWAQLFQIPTAPVLYQGMFDKQKIQALFSKRSVFEGEQEGYVVRLADSFHYDEFNDSVAKFVRKNHVQTDQHWLNQSIIPNGMID